MVGRGAMKVKVIEIKRALLVGESVVVSWFHLLNGTVHPEG